MSGSHDADELEFTEAMREFRRMFPALSADVIETVLRKNRGQVEDTIDALLSLSQENDDGSDNSPPVKSPPEEPNNDQFHVNHDGTSFMVPDSTRFQTASKTESRRSDGPFTTFPEPDSVSPDFVPTDPAYFDQRRVPPPSYHSTIRFTDPVPNYHTAVRYRPPLVGSLPHDFLRLPSPDDVWTSGNLDAIYDELHHPKSTPIQTKHTTSPTGYHPPHVGNGHFNTWRGGFPGDQMAGTSSSATSASSMFPPSAMSSSAMSRATSNHLQNTYLGIFKRMEDTKRQAGQIQEQLVENTFQRQLTDDPELGRFLDDERVALMMQNREFMKELRRNRDFMSMLERESDLNEAQRLAAKQYKKQQKELQRLSAKREKEKRRSGMSEDAPPLPDGPSVRPTGGEKDVICPESPSFRPSEHQISGYGEDNLDRFNQAFPNSMPLDPGSSAEDEQAFGERLKHMGKSSRQKFALMARKFQRKSKGASGVLGSPDEYYSGTQLIDHNDDVGNLAHFLANGYDQPEVDRDLGISNERDLNFSSLKIKK